ncbi:MAG TPA: hypothetical protein VMT02_06315 [Burkholderiales bacterium]|jgi:hypothetical protein|nr:hypothetical protein [Burkholderiales bacterium]
MKFLQIALLAAAALLALPAAAQDKPAAADSMQVLREKLKADKKQLVAANLPLTEAEAKRFWPIYEGYQKELAKVNDQTALLIVDYAKEYNAGSLTDAKARALLDRLIGIEETEVRMKRALVQRLAKVLPGAKLARYVQLENKVRALVKYEIAGEVPLAQ